MKKKLPKVKKDRLGQEIFNGDLVAFSISKTVIRYAIVTNNRPNIKSIDIICLNERNGYLWETRTLAFIKIPNKELAEEIKRKIGAAKMKNSFKRI